MTENYLINQSNKNTQNEGLKNLNKEYITFCFQFFWLSMDLHQLLSSTNCELPVMQQSCQKLIG